MSEENFTPKEAPNYTNAFLVTMGAIVFMSLWVLAGVVGFFWIVFSAAIAELFFQARRSGS